ncbi:MAG: Na/Pi cotransporter family protein, partial [Clostridiales bacterium]|nr:Na/Pi cotransporter family protein [Candidatus Apopatousia equi]
LQSIFTFITGIGVLLFGVQFFGQSLEKILGAKFRQKLNKFAGNRFSSIGFGTLITIALQSSTAATAMFVSFAGAGIITLFQGICLIFGSNIGSAIATFVLAFESINLIEIIASITTIGVLFNIFTKKNPKLKNIGNILIGLGILFAGLILISVGTSYFKTIPEFTNFLTQFTNPILLILIGVVATFLLQSTSGVVAIVISLMATTGSAGLSLASACFLVYGVNIGTCLTTVVASLTTNTDGKRIAWVHVLFNVVGTILFTILTIFTPWLNLVSNLIPNTTLQVLVVNLIFNIITTLVFIPLATPTKSLIKILVRRSKKELQSPYTLRTSELEVPTIVIKKLNFGLNTLASEFNETLLKIEEYVLKSDVKVPKTLKNNIEELKSNIQKVYSNSIRISGLISNIDQKEIIFVQQAITNFDDIVKNYEVIIENMLDNGERIVISKTQFNKLSIYFDKLKQMFNEVAIIIENFYNENFEFDCEKYTRKLIDLSEEISFAKTIGKKEVSTIIENGESKYTCYLNITNQINDMKNNLVDIAIKSQECFKKTGGDEK